MNERKNNIPEFAPLPTGAAALFQMQSGIGRKIMPSEIICLGKIAL